MKRIVLGLFLTLFVGVGSQAQSRLKLDKAESSLQITGTSTLHDWEIDVEQYSGFAQINTSDDKASISAGELRCVVESFKSGKNSMDKVVYDALEHESHPNINFTYLKTISQEKDNEHFRVIAEGELTIAGTSRIIELEMKGTYQEGLLNLQGSKSFEMSSFEVDPPSVMFGTIKAGDKITIEYSLNFHK